MAAPKRAPQPRKRTAAAAPARAARKVAAKAPAPKAKAPVEKAVRPARGELPKAILRRFVDADLLSQAAALAFWAVLSLPPLLLLLLLLSSPPQPVPTRAPTATSTAIQSQRRRRLVPKLPRGARADTTRLLNGFMVRPYHWDNEPG